MNIIKENIDSLNAIIKLKVEQADYDERVTEVLKDYRKKAVIDGFRPGKIPMGLIRKMYYKPVLVDEINKLVSESLYNYLKESEVRILGEPLPRKESEKKFDFDHDKEFDFAFDIGLAPDVNIEVTSKDKIPFYVIKIEKEALQSYTESVQKQYGEFIPVETAGDSELIKGNLVEVDENGNIVENGIFVERISMSLDMMKDDDEKMRFMGTQKGDEVIFDVKRAFPNDTEIASLLRIKKEEVPGLDGKFRCVIHEILKFEKAEINQALFDKLYGEGEVKSEEEFYEKLKDELKRNYRSESEYRFMLDVRETLLKKARLNLPVEFLKRWLVETNENITDEQVEQDFEKVEDDFRWQLIKDFMIDKLDIKVSEEEAMRRAKSMALGQYMQYGITNVPDDYLTNYAKDIMSKPEESRRVYDRIAEEKLMDRIKNIARIDENEIAMEKFKKLFK